MVTFFRKHAESFFAVAIVVIGAFLRLYRIADYMTFLGDEGRDVLVVYNILHGHLTLLGPTASVGGFFFGPIYYYFMTPFLWLFNYNPVGPAVMVALFGTATIFLVYKVGKIFFNGKVGLIAAFFYAISPVIISYSRSSWNPNPLPFFSILTILFIYKGLLEKKIKYLFLAGISLGIAMELHFVTLFLGSVVFLYVLCMWLFNNKGFKTNQIEVLIKQYIFIFLGFFIGWIPYLGFEVRHGFPNTRSILAFIFQSGKVSGGSSFFTTVWSVFFQLFSRLAFHFPDSGQLKQLSMFIITLWSGSVTLVGIICLGVLFMQFINVYKKKDAKLFPKVLLMFLWTFCSILLFGFYKKQIYDYYFSFFNPVPFLLIGNAGVYFWKKSKVLQGIIIASLLGLTVVNLSGMPFLSQPNRQLLQTEQIAQKVFQEAKNKPFNFALVTGGNSDHAYRYFFTLWGNTPITIQNAVIDPQRKTVTQQLFVVCESLPCQPLGNSLWEIAGYGRADVAGKWNVSVVEVYKLVPYKGK